MKVFRAIESGEACERLPADDRRARRRVGQQRGDRRDPPAPAPLQRLPGDGPAAARAGGDDGQAAPARLPARPAREHPGLAARRRVGRPLPPTTRSTPRTHRPRGLARSSSPSAPGASGSAALKDELLALLHRTNSSDAAAGVYIATSGGGGRISTIATIIGFCVSGAGAGALCVATGVVEAPGWILGRRGAPARARGRREADGERRAAPPRRSASSRTTEVVATSTPTPDRPRRCASSAAQVHADPPASEDPSQGTTPTSHESAPISQAAHGLHERVRLRVLGGSSIERRHAASAPATGGGEFTP